VAEGGYRVKAWQIAEQRESAVMQMSPDQRIVELCRLRQERTKMLMRLEIAKEALKKSKEYQSAQDAKLAAGDAQEELEAMLMLIERTMQPSLMAVTMPLVDRETGELLGAMPRRREG
jgi:hypothetical protein